MALKKITATDFKEAVDALTPYGEGQVVWLKELGRTDGGTGLYLVVGWTRELGYSTEEIEASGFVGDNDDYLAYKIGYFNYKPRIRYLLQDFDDFRMPYNLKDDKSHGIYAGDVWATDSYLPNEPAAWSRIADELTKDAQGIWDTWGENGELDLMESKKSESAKGSMRRKQEGLAKKNETYEDFRISDEDVSLVVNYVDVDGHGGSFSVDTPENQKSYSLQEMRDIIRGMCEECSGYASISRDGSDILIIVNAPEMDENGEWANDYYAAYTICCSVRVLHASIESFVNYLDKYNEE